MLALLPLAAGCLGGSDEALDEAGETSDGAAEGSSRAAGDRSVDNRTGEHTHASIAEPRREAFTVAEAVQRLAVDVSYEGAQAYSHVYEPGCEPGPRPFIPSSDLQFCNESICENDQNTRHTLVDRQPPPTGDGLIEITTCNLAGEPTPQGPYELTTVQRQVAS
jgi:hypothetical protein